MMSRTQVTLPPEIQRLARRRAGDMGISLAEYLRRLVTRDLGTTHASADPSSVFDLGSSGGSNVAKHKDVMLAEAYGSGRRTRRKIA